MPSICKCMCKCGYITTIHTDLHLLYGDITAVWASMCKCMCKCGYIATLHTDLHLLYGDITAVWARLGPHGTIHILVSPHD